MLHEQWAYHISPQMVFFSKTEIILPHATDFIAMAQFYILERIFFRLISCASIRCVCVCVFKKKYSMEKSLSTVAQVYCGIQIIIKYCNQPHHFIFTDLYSFYFILSKRTIDMLLLKYAIC